MNRERQEKRYEEYKRLPEMAVIVEAKKLECHTLKLTISEHHFPKKYRITMVNRMMDEAFNVTGFLMEANDYVLKDINERPFRYRAQRAAIRNCRLLIHHIETAHEMGFINADSFTFWVGMANGVRNRIAAWHLSDKSRAAKIDNESAATRG
jgi:PleD family two-component response regulator